MLGYANLSGCAPRSKKRNYRPEDCGRSPLRERRGFRTAKAASVGGLSNVPVQRERHKGPKYDKKSDRPSKQRRVELSGRWIAFAPMRHNEPPSFVRTNLGPVAGSGLVCTKKRPGAEMGRPGPFNSGINPRKAIPPSHKVRIGRTGRFIKKPPRSPGGFAMAAGGRWRFPLASFFVIRKG
jgi:hypothetical protein